ncbi:gluconate 2-dehydrogenase subunit 3 family protein [Caulobacter sp. FWC2]|uniref:gluconate 2-dehydrogenase subunit 3 family protein n=1 Tax=Caulobacter sp. FWC2 TaxID=69664 RepID=UPI000C160DE2|nr:gluconate 2-dehydrogenase subunit 3 family protein [Caulobacter sp. FWC2]PIB91591.1 Tat pathway signal protein [Caulobacter sp. FWC2]
MTEPFPTLTRRRTIAWFTAALASPMALPTGPARAASIGWPALMLKPIAAPGYGADPNMSEKKVTWPLSLSPEQRALIRICADIVLPPPAGRKPPSALGIDAFVDEWVSAPYARQAADRTLILAGLVWMDAQAMERFSKSFACATDAQRRVIFDMIAWRDRIAPGCEQAAAFFASLRAIVVLGYYTLPEGEEELGFVGNTPYEGVYPGPGPEPLRHLEQQLARLGLTMPKF